MDCILIQRNNNTTLDKHLSYLIGVLNINRRGELSSMLQKDVKQVIISLMSELDFYFEENEFIRRSNSLTYIRKLDGVTQKVEIVFFSNPSYHPGALAHIYPHMQIYIPSVNATTKEYASHLIPSKWLDQFTIRQPIQIYSHSGDFYCWMLMIMNH